MERVYLRRPRFPIPRVGCGGRGDAGGGEHFPAFRARSASAGGPAVGNADGPQSLARNSVAACDNRGFVAGVPYYTHGLRTSTGSVFRAVVHPWHPWFGHSVAVHAAVEKAGSVVFRCTLSGSPASRWLEIPAWMFDWASCPVNMRLTALPHVDVAALSGLQGLLKHLPKPGSSDTVSSGVSRTSHD
jgi:hypothetical protein